MRSYVIIWLNQGAIQFAFFHHVLQWKDCIHCWKIVKLSGCILTLYFWSWLVSLWCNFIAICGFSQWPH